MYQYLNFMRHVYNFGIKKIDRTGVGTLSIFGYQMRFNLQKGFPLLTTKKLHVKSIICELIWFLSGSTNINFLKKNNIKIWDKWADENGDLGPTYGYQWRSWPTSKGKYIDQLSEVIKQIKTDPNSRRIIVSAWNVSDIHKMKLPPCHILFQFYVAKNKLYCQLYQRSADIFLGLPFNIASYSLLIHIIAHETGLNVGDFIWTGGDCHLYLNHLEQARKQLLRVPGSLPNLTILCKPKSSFDYNFEDFRIHSYNPQESIYAPIAV